MEALYQTKLSKYVHLKHWNTHCHPPDFERKSGIPVNEIVILINNSFELELYLKRSVKKQTFLSRAEANFSIIFSSTVNIRLKIKSIIINLLHFFLLALKCVVAYLQTIMGMPPFP